MQCMETIDMDENDKRLIGNLYWTQQAAVRLENGISTFFPISRRVRQGCLLSPKLFNLYTELIFEKYTRAGVTSSLNLSIVTMREG